MQKLEGQVALVTGAGGGIGQELTKALAAEGVIVWAVGRRRQALEATAQLCRPGQVRSRPADLTRDGEIEELVDEIRRESGGMDILLHSAGIIDLGTVEEARVERLDAQYQANVRGPYVLTQLVLPMLRKRMGQIVFINSSVVTGPRPGVGQFAATQHAFRAIADTLRQEVNDDGIRVLSVYPGKTATSRQQRLYEVQNKSYRSDLLIQPADIASMVMAAITLPRTAEVTDINIRPMKKS
jgi:NADP-dependent 3-hydroxy acid dehydrogenase YdfG